MIECIVIIVVGVIIFCCVIVFDKGKSEKPIDEQEKERRRQEWAKKIEEENKEYYIDKKALEDTCGIPDKTIIIEKYNLNKEIRVYLRTKTIFVLGKTYDFDSILDSKLTDDSTIKHGKTTIISDSSSSTNNGSILGRAVVGGVVAGGVGAIIGGSTASKDTSTTSSVLKADDTLIHNYTVWITVRDIINPTIKIHLGEKEQLAHEIDGLIHAVIASK